MLLVQCTREQMLHCFPKSGTVAEIGVAKGAFSQEILKTNTPAKLHLIDPWEHQEREDYQNDVSNVNNAENETRYQDILKMFAKEISAGQVVVHRQYSHEAAAQFPDKSFDWLYVDALHTYEGALADLKTYHTKVKDSGFIFGHDYANNPGALQMGFGVVEAVNEFCKEYGYTFLVLTLESFPSYVLVKEMHDNANTFAAMLLFNFHAIEIKDMSKIQYQQKIIQFPDGSHKLLFSL